MPQEKQNIESNFVVEWVSINDVHTDPANVRTHDQKNIDAIKGSLKRFGWQHPLLIDADNIIRAGNGRFEAAKQMSLEKVPVRFVDDLTPSELTAFAIADNRTSELADWNNDDLAQQLDSLREEGFDLALDLGFDDSDIEKLIEEIDLDVDEDSGEVETINDVFHLLIECSSEADQLQKLQALKDIGIQPKVVVG